IQHIITRYILAYLAKNNGLVLHASSSLIKGRAYVFVGASTAGKSTVVSLLRPIFPTLADDRIIIKQNENKRWVCYQTRFVERDQHIQKSPLAYPLGGVFFIKKSSTCSHIKIIDVNKVAQELLTEAVIDSNIKIKKQLLKNTDVFLRSFSHFWYLSLSMNKSHVIRLMKTLTAES
ncbi:MAG: hypothetical protein V1922_04405, partial [bacterium]